MQLRHWLNELGLPLPHSPNIESIILAVVLIAGTYGIGWFVGRRVAARLTAAIHHWVGRSAGVSTALVCSTLHHAITALLLLVVGRSVALSSLGLMLVAAALGLSLAVLSWRVGRAAGLGSAVAGVVAAAVLVSSTAGMLGGLQPLIQAMSSIGLTVGTRRFSLLAAINFIIIATVLIVAARILNRVLVHSIDRASGLDVSQRTLVQKLAGIGVIVVAVLLGIDLLGIDLTALAVFSGALGLAVGFGLQKTFGNLISGLILLMDKSVKPGDVIVVGDSFGVVSKIGIRAVSIVTRDGKEHLIPNEQLMTEPVENWSYSSRNVRVHIPVGIAYSSDLTLAQQLMIQAAVECERVLAEPKPSVWLKEFGESSIDHDILVWIDDPEAGVGNVQSEVLNRIWVLFRENGIEIPFPQRDLHIVSIAAPNKDAGV